MKNKLLISLLVLFLLCGCSLIKNEPEETVKKFLDKYKNNDEVVITELDTYLSNEQLSEDELKDYKEIYLRQYSNMDYKIKDSKVNGDNALVTVEIKVYDYYKTNLESSNYYTANQADFLNDNGDVDLSKYFVYKMKKLLDTKDKISYTIDFTLAKNEDGEWEVEPLTTEQLSKIHGTYNYEED